MSHHRRTRTGLPARLPSRLAVGTVALASALALAACSSSDDGHGTVATTSGRTPSASTTSTAVSTQKPLLSTDGKVSVSRLIVSKVGNGTMATTDTVGKVCSTLLDADKLTTTGLAEEALIPPGPGYATPSSRQGTVLAYIGDQRSGHVVSDTAWDNQPGACDLHTANAPEGWLNSVVRFVVSDAAHKNTGDLSPAVTPVLTVQSNIHPGTMMAMYVLGLRLQGRVDPTKNAAVSISEPVKAKVAAVMKDALAANSD